MFNNNSLLVIWDGLMGYSFSEVIVCSIFFNIFINVSSFIG